jgi:hypothetical protein
VIGADSVVVGYANFGAVGPANKNGTTDLGVMQLNSANYGHIAWDIPKVNIKTILVIATEFGLPPCFVLAITIEENHTLNPAAVESVIADIAVNF